MKSVGSGQRGTFDAWMWARYERKPPRVGRLARRLFPELQRFGSEREKSLALVEARLAQPQWIVWICVFAGLTLLFAGAVYGLPRFAPMLGPWLASQPLTAGLPKSLRDILLYAILVGILSIPMLVLFVLAGVCQIFGTRNGVRAHLSSMGTAPCPHCGYDLGGHLDEHSDHARCPECGEQVLREQACIRLEVPDEPVAQLMQVIWRGTTNRTRRTVGVGLIVVSIALVVTTTQPFSVFIFVLGITTGVDLLNSARWWPFRDGARFTSLGVTMLLFPMIVPVPLVTPVLGWALMGVGFACLGVIAIVGGKLYRRRHPDPGSADEPHD